MSSFHREVTSLPDSPLESERLNLADQVDQ
jgi:hypothetical protein